MHANLRTLSLGLGAALAAGCGGEASVVDVGSTPYHLELALLDPQTGAALDESGDASLWPLGLPEGPVLAVTYWAERPTPPLSLAVHVAGAGVESGAAGADADAGDPCLDDPYAEGCYKQGGADSGETTVPLDIIDTEHRTVKVPLLPPALPGRAVVTVVLGGASESATLDFSLADIALAAPAAGVADGVTDVPVTVTGTAHQVVELQTTLGTFRAPDGASTATVTLVPDAPDAHTGNAVVGLIAGTDGPAIVTVGGSRSEWVRIDFAPVALVIGDPAPSGFLPGQVVHDVCVAANTDRGDVTLAGVSADALVLDADPATLAPAADPLPASCPSGSFAGYALFRWAGSAGRDTLTATWSGLDFLGSATATRIVDAATFPGYVATLDATPLDSGDPFALRLAVHLDYAALGALDERPAGNVGITFQVVSELDAYELLSNVETAPDGTAEAVYEVAADDVLQIFLQPDGWSSISLGSYP